MYSHSKQFSISIEEIYFDAIKKHGIGIDRIMYVTSKRGGAYR